MLGASSPPSYVRTPALPFLASLKVDRSLVRYDVAGSLVHVGMLGRAALLAPDEVATLQRGLRTIAREVAEGTFPWRPELEDVHTNVEVRLTELVGPVGEKLHTARSRNDQIALDERLYLKAAVNDLGQALLLVQSALLAQARAGARDAMPGYTHLQRAQPVTAGHWMLAHFWRFDRDLDRLLATVARANVSPLGAGALAGSTLPIDPAYVAQQLGFERPFENSMDAVSDRDYFAELLFDLALLGIHASGLGEEVVLFSSKEFGFLERTAALGAGSSLMPQKRNPDVAELVRGKAGAGVGGLVALLTTLKGLPLAYDRDLQEDKASVFGAVSTSVEMLAALAAMLAGLRPVPARLKEAGSDPELFATDIVERLVVQGVPFRRAHESVASLYAAPGGVDPAGVAALLGTRTAEVPALFDASASAERHASPGGPAGASLDRQLAAAEACLQSRRASFSSLDREVGRIEELLREERT